MSVNSQKQTLLYEELPNNLKNVVAKAIDEVSQEERVEINSIFKKVQEQMEDILISDYKYSASEVERIVSNSLQQYKPKIIEEGQKQRQNTSLNGGHIISDMATKEVARAEEFYSNEEKSNGLRKAYGNIIGYSEDIINDENIEANRNYNNKIEDLILTELKSEIKRKIDPYSSRNAENAFADISSVLSRKLLGQLQQDFEDNSRMLKRIISSKVEDVVLEFSKDYEKATQKEEQSKEDNKDINKLDFSQMLSTSDEIAKKDNERLNNVEEKTLENGEKIKFVNGFPQL